MGIIIKMQVKREESENLKVLGFLWEGEDVL